MGMLGRGQTEMGCSSVGRVLTGIHETLGLLPTIPTLRKFKCEYQEAQDHP